MTEHFPDLDHPMYQAAFERIAFVFVTSALAGLMIAVNFGARFFSILLIFFVIGATFYFHDFWNQPAPENAKMLIDALKNLSIIGALFMIAGYGRGPRPSEAAYGDV